MRVITDGKDETQIKKDKLSALIFAGEENPLINSSTMLSLFRKYAKEIDEYKYFASGYGNLMANFQNEINTNDEFKVFLESFVDPDNTITVFMAIGGSLA